MYNGTHRDDNGFMFFILTIALGIGAIVIGLLLIIALHIYIIGSLTLLSGSFSLGYLFGSLQIM